MTLQARILGETQVPFPPAHENNTLTRADAGHKLTGSREPGEPGAGSREPGAGSREPGAGSREPGAGSREPGAGSREPGAGSREPGAGSREPGAGSREPGAGSRDGFVMGAAGAFHASAERAVPARLLA